MNTKEIISRIKAAIVSNTSLSLDDRIEQYCRVRESNDWSGDVDIECFNLLIDQIKEEDAIATHVHDLLTLYALLAKTYVYANVCRPLEQLSVDVREILRDCRIAWEVIEDTVPQIIYALENSVYHHEYYRLLLTYLSLAFQNGKLTAKLKRRVRHLIKLQLLLDDIYRWHDHLLTKEMQLAIASMFTQEELLEIILNPAIRGQKCDPVEYTYRWEEIYYDVEDYLNERFANVHWYRGFCFDYWAVKRVYLKENYDIEWHSPAQMNPHIIFD
ncbi:MAG: hypothetical protein HDS48_06495 [Bacteroides sp.]|nr:hypothetical protein [Bacteroides sp.]